MSFEPQYLNAECFNVISDLISVCTHTKIHVILFTQNMHVPIQEAHCPRSFDLVALYSLNCIVSASE